MAKPTKIEINEKSRWVKNATGATVVIERANNQWVEYVIALTRIKITERRLQFLRNFRPDP